MNIMAKENVLNMPPADLMNMLEAEPTNLPAAAPGPDIPALREQLAILVSSGRFIGGDLLQARRDQMPFYKKKPASDSTARSSKLTC